MTSLPTSLKKRSPRSRKWRTMKKRGKDRDVLGTDDSVHVILSVYLFWKIYKCTLWSFKIQKKKKNFMAKKKRFSFFFYDGYFAVFPALIYPRFPIFSAVWHYGLSHYCIS